MQQQLAADDFMHVTGDESDDGLMLGGGVPGASGDINQMMMEDPSLGLGYPKVPQLPPNFGWIQWFLSLEDHEFFVEVDKEFIEDKMNLLELKKSFVTKQRYKECLRLLLSNKVPNEEELQSQSFIELN